VTKPSISIIIPTRNRAGQLAQCLAAIRRLDFPPDAFETIVVDDGGETPMDNIVGPLAGSMQVALYRQAHAGPAAARNAGAAQARGTWLAFIDDDCLPAPDWLQSISRRLECHPRCLVGGRLVNSLTNDPFAITSDLLITHLFRRWNRDLASAGFLVSANIAVAAACFRDVGGFSEAFPYPGAEDRDLCARWLAGGRRVVFAPECIVHHIHPGGLPSFLRQHFNYGRGAARLHRLHPEDPRANGRREPLSFYTDLFSMPRTEHHSVRAPLLAGLLLLAQVASLAGFAAERRRTKGR
jgi:cellulose synthase/poly-beta-1,6-N-acetylglucosamine synthase-like glycosyltransferase